MSHYCNSWERGKLPPSQKEESMRNTPPPDLNQTSLYDDLQELKKLRQKISRIREFVRIHEPSNSPAAVGIMHIINEKDKT